MLQLELGVVPIIRGWDYRSELVMLQRELGGVVNHLGWDGNTGVS